MIFLVNETDNNLSTPMRRKEVIAGIRMEIISGISIPNMVSMISPQNNKNIIITTTETNPIRVKL